MNTQEKVSIQQFKEKIDLAVQHYLPSGTKRPPELHSAMRYSACESGKRVRALLLLICSNIYRHSEDPMPACAAIECVHAYSLIHDDFPAIDNSALRRNKPSCHIAFDEATALLAGDALLTEAFIILSTHYAHSPELGLYLTQVLSTKSGSTGMIGGQKEDIDNEGQSIDGETLEYIHKNKTAKLIQAAILMGFAFAPEADCSLSYNDREMLGYHIGMAFQYLDDLLDAQSDSNTLGKPTGKDNDLEKLTSIKVYGLEGTRKRINQHSDTALKLLRKTQANTALLESYIESLRQRIN
ncbi:MAG: polyprenyl synthetase [Puniceicoccaceae bacterium]|nr:polyprenyl synthetase [Puniceicoccaceae bacterium]